MPAGLVGGTRCRCRSEVLRTPGWAGALGSADRRPAPRATGRNMRPAPRAPERPAPPRWARVSPVLLLFCPCLAQRPAGILGVLPGGSLVTGGGSAVARPVRPSPAARPSLWLAPDPARHGRALKELSQKCIWQLSKPVLLSKSHQSCNNSK